MQKKQKFLADQRVDKPHIDSMLNLIEDVLQRMNQYYFTNDTNLVVGGWNIIVDSGLTVKVDQAEASSLFLSERVGYENFHWLLTTDTPLTVLLSDNTTNYVEVQFSSSTGDSQTTAFWDPLANDGAGEEFQQAVDLADEQIATLISNTVGFSGDPDKVPLVTVTTSAGSVTDIADSRNVLFGLDTDFNFGTPRDDRNIGDVKDMFDAITTSIKELKGTSVWYADPGPGISGIALLERMNYMVIKGGTISWEVTGAEEVNWTDDIHILAPGRSFNYVIDAQTVASVADGDVLYVTLPDYGDTPPGSLTVNKVAKTAYLIDFSNQRNFILAHRSGTNLYFASRFVIASGETSAQAGGGDILGEALTYQIMLAHQPFAKVWHDEFVDGETVELGGGTPPVHDIAESEYGGVSGSFINTLRASFPNRGVVHADVLDTMYNLFVHTEGDVIFPHITDVTVLVPGSITENDYFLLYEPSGAVEYYVWYDKGTGTDPAISGKVGIQVDISAAVTADDVATATESAISTAASRYFATSVSTDTVTIKNKQNGKTTDVADGAAATGFTFTIQNIGGYAEYNVDEGWVAAAIADDGGAFTDETTEAKETTANDLTLLPVAPVVGDAYYFGSNAKFNKIKIKIGTAGVGTWTITWKIWNGSGWQTVSGLTDGTTGFTVVGEQEVSFDMPGTWETTTINSQGPFFYLRAEVTAFTSITTQPLGDWAEIWHDFYLEENTFVEAGYDDLHVRLIWADTGDLTSFGVFYQELDDGEVYQSATRSQATHTVPGGGYAINDEFEVPFIFTKDAKSLQYFENGVLKYHGVSYEEISNRRIKFLQTVSAGQELLFQEFYGPLDTSLDNKTRLDAEHNDDGTHPFYNRNLLINGDMRIAQRGTSFAAGNVYTLDRWKRSFAATGGTLTVSQQTDYNVSSFNALKLIIDTTVTLATNGYLNFYQKIEGYNIVNMVGKEVTLSFKARTNAGSGTVFNVVLADSVFGNTYVIEFTFTQPADTLETFTHTLTLPEYNDADTTWDFTNGVGLYLAFVTAVDGTVITTTPNQWATGGKRGTSSNSNLITAADDFWVSDVQFEIGNKATAFENRSFGVELALCQRYFCKTFDYDIAPAQNAGRYGSLLAIGASTGKFGYSWAYPKTMRSRPEITTYNPNASNSDARNTGDSTDEPVTVSENGHESCIISSTSLDATHADDILLLNCTAEAEL